MRVALRSQGTPRQMRMSNVFEPMLFVTAIDPRPWRATIKLENT
jgi:hypothetical protein